MRVEVHGDGPAGWLAAGIAAAQGAEVTLVPSSTGAPPAQAAHVHIIDERLPEVLEALDPMLAARVAQGTGQGLFCRIGQDGTVWRWDGPDLRREGLLQAFRAVALSRGVRVQDARQGGSGADLLIDATGGARALARRLARGNAVQLTLDEHGASERHDSWHWQATAEQPAIMAVQEGDIRLYLRAEGLDRQVTTIAPRRAIGVRRAADRFLRRALGEVAIPREASCATMIGTGTRLLRIEAAHVPLVCFGDSLLQTSPRKGFGLLSVVQQGLILKDALSEGAEGVRQALEDGADCVWQAQAMQSLFSCA